MVARGRTLSDPRWSPGGDRLAWIDSLAGRADLVVAPADGSGPSFVLTPDTPTATRGAPFTWTADGAEIVYAAADGRLLAVRAAGGPTRVLSRDGRASAPALSPDGSRVAFVLERDDACEIAAVPLDASAWPVRISTGADWAVDPAWSADGRAIAWHEWDFPYMAWDSSRIVLRPVDGCVPAGPPVVVAGGPGEAVSQPRFAPDGSALGFVSDRAGFMNLWLASAEGKDPRPALEEPFEHAESTWGPGQRSFAWAPDGGALVVNRNEAGFGRLILVPAGGGTAGRELSRGWHHGLHWSPAGLACMRSGARTPPRVTVLQPGDHAGPLAPSARWAAPDVRRRVLAQAAPGALEAAGPVEPEAVTWTSEDGAIVHGLLYRPPAPALGDPSLGDRPFGDPPPLFVYVHGGPTGSSVAGWVPRHQFWVSRGWAVLTPNYRGSTGYGRAYTQALTGNWGVADVADVASGIRHAGSVGWGDPRRVAIDGGSAGGFTLLLVCARYPELVKAAVARYGVTDLFDLAETTHRLESRYLDQIVGPLPEAADRYREHSPIHHADRISTPLLVLQGDRDDTVPKPQADAFVEALRRRGGVVEYHVYEGEGHGWSRPEPVMDELTRAEKFLTRWVLQR